MLVLRLHPAVVAGTGRPPVAALAGVDGLGERAGDEGVLALEGEGAGRGQLQEVGAAVCMPRDGWCCMSVSPRMVSKRPELGRP